MEIIEKALTFDDVLLVPQYSDVTPTVIETETFFARNIRLRTPLISSSMDTVTENKMARVMAQNGGLGIIHKNMKVEEQALEVEKVKKYESGMIMDPITLGPEAKV
ncbi:MAG: IMP dehydrogenase, partial [Bdellovibrionales bacterium]|nr:IMP dehydrogenase [Bdellovibrionales bacterium]